MLKPGGFPSHVTWTVAAGNFLTESLSYHFHNVPSGSLLQNNAGVHTLFKFNPKQSLSFCTPVFRVVLPFFPWLFKLAAITSEKSVPYLLPLFYVWSAKEISIVNDNCKRNTSCTCATKWFAFSNELHNK